MDASIAIESTNVTAIGPKAKLMESQILPSQSAAVQIAGLRLRVTLRDSLIYENSHAGLFFKSVAGSENAEKNSTKLHKGQPFKNTILPYYTTLRIIVSTQKI